MSDERSAVAPRFRHSFALAQLSGQPGVGSRQSGKMADPDPEPSPEFPHLNPSDPTLSAWREPIPNLQGDRPPGLIHLNRYPIGMAPHGIATFLQRPVAMTAADLSAANVDVAMLGAGMDMSSGMRGAGYGPRALRAHDTYLPTVQSGLTHQHTRVDALSELVICDYGDAPVDPDSTYRSVEPVRALVREIAETGTMPFIVGGDHSLMYPDVAALADIYGKGKIGVVHFDAHYDAGSAYLGHAISHGTPVRRLIEQGHVSGKTLYRLVCAVTRQATMTWPGCVIKVSGTTSWPKWSVMAGKGS